MKAAELLTRAEGFWLDILRSGRISYKGNVRGRAIQPRNTLPMNPGILL